MADGDRIGGHPDRMADPRSPIAPVCRHRSDPRAGRVRRFERNWWSAPPVREGTRCHRSRTPHAGASLRSGSSSSRSARRVAPACAGDRRRRPRRPPSRRHLRGSDDDRPRAPRRAANLDAVLVALGGGALASGVGHVLRELSPTTEVDRDPADRVVRRCRSRGATAVVVDTDSIDTIADVVAGRHPIPEVLDDLLEAVEQDSVLVAEESIVAGMRLLHELAGLIVEKPSAASWAWRRCSKTPGASGDAVSPRSSAAGTWRRRTSPGG